MNIKMRIIKMVGLSRLSPRWLKILCLQATMNQIQNNVTKIFESADLSKMTPEQKRSLQACLDKMNVARGKGIQG
ncbi:TPA: hypothetical protein ACPEY2_001707 [Citrobacter amalonaticus]